MQNNHLSRYSNRSSICAAAAVLAVFSSVPFWADKGLVLLAAVVMIYALFGLSFNLVFGLTGLVSFGHAAFFAAGAYTTGYLLQSHGEVPFLLSWIAGGAVGMVVAALVAVVALRRASGIYFSILTLALAELLHILISKTTFLGRQDGLTGIQRPSVNLGLFTVDLSSELGLYFFTLAACTCLGMLAYVVWHNRTGRVLGAVRQDAERVRFLGVDVHSMRFGAFVLSGALVGMAGGLYAPNAQLLTPALAHWSFSAFPILFCLVGGISHFWGPVLGSIVFIGLEHATRNVVGLSEIIIGLVLLLVVLVFPGGLIGGVQNLTRSRSTDAPRAGKG